MSSKSLLASLPKLFSGKGKQASLDWQVPFAAHAQGEIARV
jgi:hypothetical protein